MPDHTFDTAASFIIPLGRYKGKTLDEVAYTDEGLLYLDYMRGKLDSWSTARKALDAYLDDPVIVQELSNLIKP